MTSEQHFVDAALRAWQFNIDRVEKAFRDLTDEQLEVRVAPGRNRMLYLLGHIAPCTIACCLCSASVRGVTRASIARQSSVDTVAEQQRKHQDSDGITRVHAIARSLPRVGAGAIACRACVIFADRPGTVALGFVVTS